MGKSTTGPDAGDSILYLKTVDREAKCKSTILVLLAGSRDSLCVTFNILSVSDEGRPDGPAWTCSSSWSWPNRENKTFEGALFRAVVEHDKALSQRHWTELMDLN